MIRRAHQRVRRPHPVLAKHAVERAAQCRSHFCLRRLAAEPALEETTDHPVIRLERGHTGADAVDHARAIGKRDQRKFLPRAVAALHRQQIAIVDCRGLQPDQHLSGTRHGHRLLDQHHGVDPAGALQLIGFQWGIPSRVRTARPIGRQATGYLLAFAMATGLLARGSLTQRTSPLRSLTCRR